MDIRLLIFDDELLSRSKSGTLWGRIYFDLGQEAFPDRGWSDMVVAFIGAWQKALIQIATFDADRRRVHFMDGPFAIDITPCADGFVILHFIHKDLVKHSMKGHINDLLQDAVSSSNHLLSICERHGWLRDPETQELMFTTQGGVETLAALEKVR